MTCKINLQKHCRTSMSYGKWDKEYKSRRLYSLPQTHFDNDLQDDLRKHCLPIMSTDDGIKNISQVKLIHSHLYIFEQWPARSTRKSIAEHVYLLKSGTKNASRDDFIHSHRHTSTMTCKMTCKSTVYQSCRLKMGQRIVAKPNLFAPIFMLEQWPAR